MMLPKLNSYLEKQDTKAVISMLRNLIPVSVAQAIVGVQPMPGEFKIFNQTSKLQSKYKFSRAKWYEANHRYDDYDAVFEWCTENFGPRPKNPDAWTRWYDIHIDKIRFRDAQDYEWFLLRWG